MEDLLKTLSSVLLNKKIIVSEDYIFIFNEIKRLRKEEQSLYDSFILTEEIDEKNIRTARKKVIITNFSKINTRKRFLEYLFNNITKNPFIKFFQLLLKNSICHA